MTRTPLFPHTAAWAIVAALLVGLAAPQLCTAHSRTTPQQQAEVPSVEIIPDERPDRRGYDENAFAADEMNGQSAKTRLVHR